MIKLFFIILFSFISCGGASTGSSSSSFSTELDLFATNNGLSEDWKSWMLTRQSTHSPAYSKGRGDKTVRVNVIYDEEINYDPAWESEDEHMQALEKMAELQFPGWDFTFRLNDSSADVTAVLGYTGSTSFADTANQKIYLTYETIFAHEYAHTLGIGHHYCDNPSDTANCGSLPEGEGDCIMNRDSVSWGYAEQFLFDLTGERNDDQINEVLEDILNRYP